MLLFCRQSIKSCLLAAVKAHRLNMDSCCGHDISSLFSIEIVKIREMLEVVCIYLAAVNNIVRLYIVGENLNVKCDVLCCKDILCDRKDLRLVSSPY